MTESRSQPAIQVESVRCDLCGSNEPQVLPYGGYRIHGTILDLVRCTRCGLRFVNPRPTQDALFSLYSGKFFEDPLYWSGALDTGSYFDNIEGRRVYYSKVASDFHSMAGKYVRPLGRLLDVGCAGGLLMKELGTLGWQTYGVDVSVSATCFARDRLGLNVVTGSLFDARFPDGMFDVVVVKDVLEHVSSPRALLREVNRILAENGIVLVHVPTEYSTPSQRILDLRCWVLARALSRTPFRRTEFAPPHLYYFTHSTMKKYAREANFKTVEAYSTSPMLAGCGGVENRTRLVRTLRRLLRASSGIIESILHRGMETTFLLAKSD